MGWPIDDLSRDNLNSDTDDPALARPDLSNAVAKLQQAIGGRGTTNGVCELDADALVPVSRIPTIPVSRGGTGATTAAAARSLLGMGTAATLNAGVANGAATLNANGELTTLPAGASVAPSGYLLQSNGAWIPSPAPGAGSISQSLLKTSDGAISVLTSSSTHYVLPGGQYGFYPRFVTDSLLVPGASASVHIANTLFTFVEASYINVTPVGGTVDVTIKQRYVQASPPYDLGDGEAATFLFCVVRNSDRSVVSTWLSDDPPWANNGPTNIRADEYDNTGSACKWVVDIPFDHDAVVAARKDPVLRARLREALRLRKRKLVPITQEMKQADMQLIPHPFGDLPRGHSVVLVDPVGDIALDLRELSDAGEDVGALLTKDYVRVRSQDLGRVSPRGVFVRQVAWRDNG